jgi:hypothetical protein
VDVLRWIIRTRLASGFGSLLFVVFAVLIWHHVVSALVVNSSVNIQRCLGEDSIDAAAGLPVVEWAMNVNDDQFANL